HFSGHTLGLHHTHTRRDRDRYVVLKMENVRSPAYTADFVRRVRRGVLDGVPYDVGSIMHYSVTTFARSPSSFTLLPRDSIYAQTLGQRSRLSFYDVHAINNAYCRDSCSSTLSECQNGGYPHPDRCDSCICPDGTNRSIYTRVQYP
ncbi:hypothetical protein PMAYCL1PPCAC_23397, partial [Pristionchus mayeri]